MNLFGRQKIAMLVGEFLGAGILTLGMATLARAGGAPYFVGTIAGVAFAALLLTVGRVTGGHFNPVITLGMWTVRRVPTLTAVLYIAVQVLGGLAALQLYEYMNTTLSLGDLTVNWEWRILVAEAVGTFIFAFGYAAAVFNEYVGLKRAAVVGTSLFLGVLIAGLGSNALLNPAVALGMDSWGRAYVLGPVIGAIVGINLYYLLFAPAEALVMPSLLRRIERRTTATTAPARSTRTSAKTRRTTAKRKTTSTRRTRR